MAPSAAESPSAIQAERLRRDGNIYFKKDRFGAAIDAYTEAITLCPNVPVYWTNRALCHRKRNDWTKVEEDCRRAIQLDHSSFKVRVLDSPKFCKSDFNKLYEEATTRKPLIEAHYMLGLALQQRHEYADGIKELERALDLGRGANPQSYIVEEIWQEVAKAKYQEWEHESNKRSWELQTLNFDFRHLSLISFSSTSQVGEFDPITREPLHLYQLIPNLAIKEAVQAFLDKHGWAYKMD
ncbi:hypothetical protein C3L33_07246, partial [Rhododendron williamsianum]